MPAPYREERTVSNSSLTCRLTPHAIVLAIAWLGATVALTVVGEREHRAWAALQLSLNH